jgi:hypothetical protein
MGKADGKKKLLEEKCKDLAFRAMRFTGKISDLLDGAGMELRPGKDGTSFKAAVERGLKQGRGKLENEIMFIGMALEKQVQMKEETK